MVETGLTYQGKPRTCGLRLSVSDVFVLVLGIATGIVGWIYIGELALFVPFVVVHFFLFCNIFRVRRTPELVWAGLFLLNCFIWSALGQMEVEWIFALQLIVTFALIMNELRSPHYHGVFARRINPRIDDYLADKL